MIVRNFVRIGLVLLALAVMPVAEAQSSFVHPGMSHKRSDLDRMKAMVEAQIDPWHTSYQTMAAESKASFDYTVRGNTSMTVLYRDSPKTNLAEFESDSRAAYYNALRWYIEGDTRYADKAVEILNAWTGLTYLQHNGTRALTSCLVYQMLEAAEIIKSTYSGWAVEDIQKFKDMLVYPGYSNTTVPDKLNLAYEDGGEGTWYWRAYLFDYVRAGNQEISAMRACMAMGIFLDNEIIYDRPLRYAKNMPHRPDDLPYSSGPHTTGNIVSQSEYQIGFNYTIGDDIDDYGFNGVLTNYIWENGQAQESSRDLWHTWWGMHMLGSMGEMAWSQGDDFWNEADSRILLGYEYHNKYSVSYLYSYPDQPTEWTPTVASGEFLQRMDRTGRTMSLAIAPYYNEDTTRFYRTKYNEVACWELAVGHYLGRGLKSAEEAKWTLRARDTSIERNGNYETKPASGNGSYLGYGGLTYRRPDFCHGDPISGFSSGLPVYAMNVLPGTIEAENFDYFTTIGEGRTYHDLTATNSGGQYRTSESVDITNCSEGGHALTSLEADEWTTYTVAVPSAGLYDISIRYAASQAGGKIKFSFGGVDKTGEVPVPFGASNSTGLNDWQTFMVASGVSLSKGVQSMKVSIAGASDSFLLNNLSILRDPDILAGHWKFDDTGGSLVTDSSSHGNDGTNISGSWVTGIDGGALNFDGSSSQVTLPASTFSTISNEISISMWVNGSAQQPKNGSSFYAVAGNNRALGIHLPFGDSSIYWDAGNSTGYDRISKPAVDSQYKNGWNHWVFTKDAIAGTMKIYHNGALWHSGTGKSKTITGITAATIGSQITGVHYDGSIDDVRLYGVALADQEIASLYYQAPLFAVDGLMAEASGATQIDLNWNAAAGASGYHLKRSLTSGGPYTLVASGLTTTNHVDTDLSTGTNYYYVVNAVYDGTESGESAEATAAPNAPDTSPVVNTASLPTGLVGVASQQTLTATGGNGGLTWSLFSGALPSGMTLNSSGILSGTPTAAGIDSFTVKVTDADGDFDTQALTFTIYAPENAPVAKFTVSAGDVTASADDGNVAANTLDELLNTRWSAQGDGQWIRYDLGAVKIVHSLEIAWLNGASRFAMFDLEVSDDDTTWTPAAIGLQSSGTTVELETVDVPDTLARYVRIVGRGNSVSNWNSITEVEIWGAALLPPAVPSGVTAAPGNGQVMLAWPASAGAIQYHLKRSTTSGSGFTIIASTEDGSYLDTDVVNGTIYYYTASAGSAAGESADSQQTGAKPYAPIAPEELVAPAVILSGESMEFTVQTAPGRIYQLQRNETLTPGAWQDIGAPVTGTGVSIKLSDPDVFTAPACFYRLQIQP